MVRTPDGLRIRDDAGHLSTEEDLEQRIVLTRGAAEEVEPLVKHIDDLPEVVARMRAGGTAGVESELRKLLERDEEPQPGDHAGIGRRSLVRLHQERDP